MGNSKKAVERRVEQLVRDLISAACSTLQHDTDVLDGQNDYEIWSRNTLTEDFKKVLIKHGVISNASHQARAIASRSECGCSAIGGTP
jgi:hypothetical protein